MTTIAIDTYNLVITYTDSANPPVSVIKNTQVIASDKCLSQGIVKPISDGDLDMIYIIESPQKQIDFSGITNGECMYSTTIHINFIDSGVLLSSRGLVHTDTVFESYPPTSQLATFRVEKDAGDVTIGDGYLSLFSDNYGFDGD